MQQPWLDSLVLVRRRSSHSAKKEGIELRHLLTKAERTEVIELLKTNLNALATAKQLGVNHKTVLAIANKERIDIKAMRQAAKGRKTLPFTQWARGQVANQCFS